MIIPLFPFSAAMIENKKTRAIVIADLHIGWELALSEQGIHVPTQTPKLLKKLTDLLTHFNADTLLILGDVKHTVATAQTGEWHDVPDFFTELRKSVSKIQVLRGNHDGNLEPLLPETVEIAPASGIAIGDVGFFHGHRWPSPTLLGCRTLVMGHVHPVVVFRDLTGFRITRQVWVKADCEKLELTRALLEKNGIKVNDNPEKALHEHFKVKPRASKLFIMPSFNDFLGGRPLNEKWHFSGSKDTMIAGPLLRSGAVDMINAETYLLDGTFLGTLNQLRNLS
jgi:putative SbcD/Mre11-related phosphoesterase